MRILVIALAGVGDTLLATPLIHELRANFSKARIDAVVLWQGSKDLLEGNPFLDNLYQKNLINAGTGDSLRFLWRLRRQRYDLSVNTHPQSRTHYRFVARLINAPVRVTHRYHRFSMLDKLLVNRTIKQDYEKHVVENNLALLELTGARCRLAQHDCEVYLAEGDRQWAEDFILAKGLADRKRLGVHVGSGGTKNLPLKRWPVAHYGELFKRLSRTLPELAILLLGGPAEAEDHAKLLAEAAGCQVFWPRTESLRQAAALLTRCDAFLSVDTALMHLAAAMKVPRQIVIEAPTLNKTNLPYRNPYVLVKNPVVNGRNLEYYRYDGGGIRGSKKNLLRCMASVTVDSVYQALAETF